MECALYVRSVCPPKNFLISPHLTTIREHYCIKTHQPLSQKNPHKTTQNHQFSTSSKDIVAIVTKKTIDFKVWCYWWHTRWQAHLQDIDPWPYLDIHTATKLKMDHKKIDESCVTMYVNMISRHLYKVSPTFWPVTI